jgi:hypothetical protein
MKGYAVLVNDVTTVALRTRLSQMAPAGPRSFVLLPGLLFYLTGFDSRESCFTDALEIG